jgi:short-subunit dehydrogenase
MKKIVIIGASSGIGRCVAREFIKAGWRVGIASRNEEKLRELQSEAPLQVEMQEIDVCEEGADNRLYDLITKIGGMDVFFLASGVGFQNPDVDLDVEMSTISVDVTGFTAMINAALNYFKLRGSGHIAAISSIAATRGIGVAASYSASKSYQATYLTALAQLVHLQHLNIHVTDIRPGFVDTPLLDDGNHYPMLLRPERVAHSIYRAIIHRRHVKIIDWRYSVLVFFWRLIPSSLWRVFPVSTGNSKD